MVVWHPQSGPGMTRTVTVTPDGKLFEEFRSPGAEGQSQCL